MSPSSQRRQRLHELLLALIAREEDLQLMDSEHPQLDGGTAPGRWLDPVSYTHLTLPTNA